MFTSSYPAFFKIDSEGWIIGENPARGPWEANGCHAGPVAGMLARAFEMAITDKQLMRMSVEVLKPVPMDGFKIETEVSKKGRMVSTAKARLLDRQDRLMATANSLHMTQQQLEPLPTVSVESPTLEDAAPGEFPIRKTMHGLPSFSSGIEVRYPPGEDHLPGPTTMWMRTLPLVESEDLTPFQSLCPLADCGNGISRNQEARKHSFINPDLTIVMHRAPESRWLASKAKSHWQSNGMGLSEATLFDEQGPVGVALQTLLITEL